MFPGLSMLGGGGTSSSSSASTDIKTTTGAITFGNKNTGKGSGDGLKFSPLILGAIGLALLGGLFLFFHNGK